jgi:hypothetical protein
MFTIMAMTLPFLCRQKQKPRFIAALAESLSCSLFSWRLAPILHLRRKWKPIAAKQAERAK